MITVVGEALIDLVISPDGSVEAKLGGAPYNTARACGRLGAAIRFVGALSIDRFGELLTERLVADGVDVSSAPRVDVPTTLAAAELDETGTATYRFYIDGTSAGQLTTAAGGGAGDVLFTGGLALVLEPMATTVEQSLADAVPGRLVMVDVNCRPLVIANRDAYAERIARVVRYADIVKVSDEDLAYLAPGDEPAAAAQRLLEAGPSAVLVTAGGEGVHVLTADHHELVAVEPVDVVDTIGAGDSFGAGFVTWLVDNGVDRAALGDAGILRRAVGAANCVAGIVVTRRGSDPPWRDELPADWST